MHIQSVRLSSQTFGTKVIYTPELTVFLKKKGYDYSHSLNDDKYWLERNGKDDIMSVGLEITGSRRNNNIVGVRSVRDKLGRVFVSQGVVKEPFIKKNQFASLQRIYDNLEKLPLKEVRK